MAHALKEVYSQEFFDIFLNRFTSFYPINSVDFQNKIFQPSWNSMELKQRMSHVAATLHLCMPIPYKHQISILLKFIDSLHDVKNSDWMLAYMFIPDFVEQFGLQDYDYSIAAIEKITQFTSCEFVIRRFIEKYPEKTINQMYTWSKHEHSSVRRLSCEGLRIYLPWGIRVKYLIDNYHVIFPVLEQVKDDTSLFVRKSVANSLNDLSKLDSKEVIRICKQWKNTSANTDWIIKNGLRTLLKSGNKDALEISGISNNIDVSIAEFTLITDNVTSTHPLEWKCIITNNSLQDEMIRVEYVIYFLRNGGKYSKKVFHIHQKVYKSKEQCTINKSHKFKPITTRKYYRGKQYISLQINGVESKKRAFLYSDTN